MTPRQRVQAALDFQPPDRLPCNESFWDGTVAAWREQGMPTDVDPADFFQFDICSMFLDASPRLEQRILHREGGFITYNDRFGYTVRKRDGLSGTLEFLEHVTVDRAAWERIKPQFHLSDDPAKPARIDQASYFAHFDAYPSWQQAVEQYQRLRKTDRYLLYTAYGPWEATWRHRDMERLLLDVATDPDWVAEMADTYQDLVISILDKCLALGMRPDGFFMVEDLGWNLSLLISPGHWRRILRPAVVRLGEYLARHDIAFWIHSDGAIAPLLDDLIECGVQALNPLEVTAGCDSVEVRRRYGRRLALYGNIDVKKMLGPRAQLEAEIRRKAPLARQGGFIMHSDHSVPPQVSLDRYRGMLELARNVFDQSR